MSDIWSFLLQTLTVSTTALVILIIKRIFRDKLTPLWQFTVWSVFGISLIIPAGLTGRFIIYNWATLTEFLKLRFTGDYESSFPTTFFPFTAPSKPENIFDILFYFYFAGVLFFIIKHIFSFIKLRALLKRSATANAETTEKIKETAKKYSLPTCKCVTVPDISSPFICGLFSPVLVLPVTETDEKVILHELFHLKYKDVLWGILISLFRSIHWCNPFLWFIFNKINNDIEELCDSRVLSVLKGEERREYGNILLSMANDKYACFPGTSSVSNGGKNISSRIQTITRFNKYPVPSSLVSICIIALISCYLLIGMNVTSINTKNNTGISQIELDYLVASSRSIRCTTPAGAIDTYTKAVMKNDGILRLFTAPLSEQKKITDEIRENLKNGNFPLWDNSFDETPKNIYSFNVYNLSETERNTYTAYIGFELISNQENSDRIAYQKITITKENGRWIVIPMEEFRIITTEYLSFGNSCQDLPTYCYRGQKGNFIIEKHYQHILTVSSNLNNSQDQPCFNAYFDYFTECTFSKIIYTGNETEKASLKTLQYGFKPMKKDDAFPEIENYGSSGATFDKNNVHSNGGSGYSENFKKSNLKLPDQVACSFNVNREGYIDLILTRVDTDNE